MVSIDVRTQEQIINRAALIHKMLFNKMKDYSFMCIELLMTVLHSHYNDVKKFSSWLNPYSNVYDGIGKEIPFGEFFNSKFEKAGLIPDPLHSETPFITTRLRYISSLYGVIAYLWYRVALEDDNDCEDCFIGLTNSIGFSQQQLLEENVADLKQFSSMLKLIK